MKKINLENMKNKVKELKENENVMKVVKYGGCVLGVGGALLAACTLGKNDTVKGAVGTVKDLVVDTVTGLGNNINLENVTADLNVAATGLGVVAAGLGAIVDGNGYKAIYDEYNDDDEEEDDDGEYYDDWCNFDDYDDYHNHGNWFGEIE